MWVWLSSVWWLVCGVRLAELRSHVGGLLEREVELEALASVVDAIQNPFRYAMSAPIM
jgi:hypothetical protein